MSDTEIIDLEFTIASEPEEDPVPVNELDVGRDQFIWDDDAEEWQLRHPARNHSARHLAGGEDEIGLNSLVQPASPALGQGAVAAGGTSVAVGSGALAQGENTIAIGREAEANGGNDILVGRESITAEGRFGNVCIGWRAETTNSRAVCIGMDAVAGGGLDHIAIGRGASSVGSTSGVVVGAGATGASSSTVVGLSATAVANATAVGRGANAAHATAVAFGRDAAATHGNSVALGRDATTTGSDQVHVGNRNLVSGRDGGYLELVSPDGSEVRRISIDNSGDLVVAAP